MQELWIRRGGLLAAAAGVAVVAASGGADVSLGMSAAAASYLVLFGAPQFFLRRRTTVESWLGALELAQLVSALTIALCLPRGSSATGSCYTTYNYSDGSVASRQCTTASEAGWTVPVAHLFTGDRVHTNQPWLTLTLVAVVLGVLGAIALWVCVARHLRNNDWRDLQRDNPMVVGWPTLQQTGGPSTTRPASVERTEPRSP